MTQAYLPPLTPGARRWARFAGVLVLALFLAWLAGELSAVLTPLAIGLVIAYILNPLVTYLERYRISRTVSVALSVLLLLGLAAVLLLLVAAQIFELTISVPARISGAIEALQTTLRNPESAPAWFVELRDWLQLEETRVAAADWLRREGPAIQNYLLGLIGAITAAVGATLANIFVWLSLFVLVPMYALFFLWKFNVLVDVVRDHLPAEYRPTIVDIVSTADRAVADFFRGRLLICIGVGVLSGVGWLLVGVPYSLLLGLLAGAFNLVPYLTLAVLPPALLLAYLDAQAVGANWVVVVSLTMGVYLVVQAIESFVLTPIITGQTSGLHWFTTIVVLLIGAELAGLLGMLLSIPVTSTLKSLATRYVMPEIRRLAAQPEPAPIPSARPSAPPVAAPAGKESR